MGDGEQRGALDAERRADRTAQPDEAIVPAAVTDQLAADDPVVLGLGTSSECGEAPRTKAGEQNRVAEDRVHTGCEGGRIGSQAVIRPSGLRADE